MSTAHVPAGAPVDNVWTRRGCLSPEGEGRHTGPRTAVAGSRGTHPGVDARPTPPPMPGLEGRKDAELCLDCPRLKPASWLVSEVEHLPFGPLCCFWELLDGHFSGQFLK